MVGTVVTMEKKEQRPLRKIREDAVVQSFGEYLKRERELREISLREISDDTKVSFRYLEALEEDNESRLPAPVFIKGFIRSYAQYIGLDPDEALLRYQEYQKGLESSGTRSAVGADPSTVAPPPRNRSLWIWVVLILLLVGGAFYYGVHFWSCSKAPQEDRFKIGFEEVFLGAVKAGKDVGSPTVSAPETPESAPVAVETVPETVSSQEAHPAVPLVITLIAEDRTWVALNVDGEKDYDVMLRKGEKLKVPMVDSMKLNIGNAGGLLIRYGDKTIGPLGKPGEVRKNVLLNRRDFEEDDGGESSSE